MVVVMDCWQHQCMGNSNAGSIGLSFERKKLELFDRRKDGQHRVFGTKEMIGINSLDSIDSFGQWRNSNGTILSLYIHSHRHSHTSETAPSMCDEQAIIKREPLDSMSLNQQLPEPKKNYWHDSDSDWE